MQGSYSLLDWDNEKQKKCIQDKGTAIITDAFCVNGGVIVYMNAWGKDAVIRNVPSMGNDCFAYI